MKEQVLVFPEKMLHSLGHIEGFQPDFDNELLSNKDFLNSLAYLNREEAEKNPRFKQLIPYCILTYEYKSDVFNDTNTLFFVYKRSKKGNESRLHDLYSLGVGGHINPCDGEPVSAYNNAMLRELKEEVDLVGDFTNDVIGYIYDASNEVGRVHFGIVHHIQLINGYLKFNDPSLENGQWWQEEHIRERKEEFENWSKLIIEHNFGGK